MEITPSCSFWGHFSSGTNCLSIKALASTSVSILRHPLSRSSLQPTCRTRQADC